MSKELLIRTIQIAKHSWVNDLLDVTVKSGDPVFAPTWHMVWSYKNRQMSQEDYTCLYQTLMENSFIKNRYRWEEVVNLGSVTLACYCPTGSFCHRHLLAEYLKEAAESLGYTVIMGGEVIRAPKLSK